MSLIDVRNVKVKLNGASVVDGVSFSVERGDIVAIIGPNGSGKTTLLKAMLGIVPFDGEVRFEGAPMAKKIDRIGYVPQRFEFDKTFPITVGEFFSLFASERVIAQSKAVDDTGVRGLFGKRLGELSGGQLQRVLIARALLNAPEVLILDEPTAGIDVSGEKTFYELIAHLHKTHKIAVILVSHEMSMVYALATMVVCLNRDMVCYGAPQEAITREVIEKLYGKNLALKAHEHPHLHT